MKKLLSFLAAGVLTFGLIGCSGDLHDVKASPLGVLGIGVDGPNQTDNYAVLMEMINEDGSEQKFEFIWSSSALYEATNGKKYGIKDGWGTASSFRMAIALPSAITSGDIPVSKWTDVRRSEDHDEVYCTIGDEEFTPLYLSPSYPEGNVIFNGLIDGETYVLYAKYDSSAESVSVRLDGKMSDPTQFRIVADSADSKNFPAKKNDKDIIYAMSQAGNDYTYQFIAVADEDIVFSIKNDLLGTMAKGESVAVKENHEYKFKFTKKPGEEGKFESEEIPFLKNAEFLTNSQHSYDFYAEYDWFSENVVLFEAPVKSFEFKVNRIAGDSTIMWGKGAKDISALDAVPTTLKYISDSKKEIVQPVKISGLNEGTYYYLKFEGDKPTELKAVVEEVPEFDDNLAEFSFVGNVTKAGWNDNGEKLQRQSDGSYAVEFIAAQASDIGKITTAGWGTKYATATELKLGDRQLIPKISTGDPSITFSGLEVGKKYKLIVEGFLKDLVYMSVAEVQ